MPNLLAQTAFRLGDQKRDIESARAAAIAEVRAAELDRNAKTQQTALGNIPDISTFLGGNFAGSLAAGGLPPEGALSGSNATFANRSAELGQAGLLASNLKDLGSAQESFVEGGSQLPAPEILAAIAGKNPQNIREIPTGNQTRLQSSIALGLKFNDNLFEVYDTRTGERIPGTDLSQDEATALNNAFGRGIEKRYLGTRLVRAASNAPIVTTPTEIDTSGSTTATPKDDPNVVVDPDEADPTNDAAEPPQVEAGTAETKARERVDSSKNLSGVTTITRPDGNYSIQRNPDGSGVITVPDGRTVPFTAEQATSMGL